MSDDPFREDKDPLPPQPARKRRTVRRARIHELKTWPTFFEAVLRGDKAFEWRKYDRDFAVGDELVLKEWCPLDGASHSSPLLGYTDRSITARITYILTSFGVPEGYCVLGIQVITNNNEG